MRLALGQLDPTVGDLEGNLEAALLLARRAADEGADLLLLPELVLCGYPPEDLIAKPHFVAASERAAEEFAARSPLPAVVGYVRRDAGGTRNAAAYVADGAIRHVYHKRLLPNYGVFDEERYFEPGAADALLQIDDAACALTVCEDVWRPATTERLAGAGARVVLNISASPFHAMKGDERESMLAEQARANGVWIAYCNLVGGQDELVFDGRSVVIAPSGEVVARAAAFAEDLLVVDIDPAAHSADGRIEDRLSGMAEVYEALTLGLRDYVRKNGFTDVVLGLSGGVDSALTATIAADALGPGHTHGVLLPSRYSSPGSLADAKELAANLGIATETLPIEGPFSAMLDVLAPVFGDLPEDVTEENLQARVRGTLLMALSNKFGWLVLATGNKSELSVGYSTLYGDMVGGFAPIKDVFKTSVYRLCRWRNERGPVAVPEATLAKPPSAELRPDQTDQDTLPPYDVLDAVLIDYVERDRSTDEIAATGVPADIVARIVRMVDAAEYKRRQGPLGIKISPKAFGKDRRMPVTNRFGG